MSPPTYPSADPRRLGVRWLDKILDSTVSELDAHFPRTVGEDHSGSEGCVLDRFASPGGSLERITARAFVLRFRTSAFFFGWMLRLSRARTSGHHRSSRIS